MAYQASCSKKDTPKKFFPLQLKDLTDSYTVYLEEGDYRTACRDPQFAAKLLQNCKKTVNKQSQNALSSETDEESLTVKELEKVPLRLQDSITNETYTLFVTIEECNRATTDLVFATELLEKHKANISMNVPSTSTNTSDNNENIECSSSTRFEKIVCKKPKKRMQNNAKQTGATELWPHEPTLLLLSLYKDNDELYTAGKITSSKLWSNIEVGMRSKGYSYTIEQCQNKVECFKRSYKNAREKRGKTGRPPKDIPYGDVLEDLFSNKKWANPIALVGSEMPLGEIDNKPCKKQKVSLDAAKEKYFKDFAEDRRLRRESTESYHKQKLDLLKKGIDILEKLVK